jgi:hypothetical protein
MYSPGVYKVVIESSNRREKYLKEYIGPALGEDHAVEQARTVLKERADDRVIEVEAVDRRYRVVAARRGRGDRRLGSRPIHKPGQSVLRKGCC